MVNPFLVVVTVILSLAIIAGSIYVLIYFQHPEDRLVAWGPKIVVVLSLTLVCFSVLMLPLDKANRTKNDDDFGGFPMDVLWLIVFITLACLVVVVIPFSAFYYEGDEYDEEGGAASQLASAIKGTFITLLVFAVIAIVMYIPLGIAQIPTVKLNATFITAIPRSVAIQNISELHEKYPDVFEIPNYCINETRNYSIRYNVSQFFSENETVILTNTTVLENITFPILIDNVTNQTYFINAFNATNFTCFYLNNSLIGNGNITDRIYTTGRKKQSTEFRVSFALWLVSIIVFFGWVLFILFGGIGLVALPMDCIASWQKRPIRISLDKYTAIKREIGEMATKLLEKGKAIQDKQKRGKERKRDRRNYNKFRQAVFMLEEDYERLQECYKRQGGKLILHFLTFIFGIIGVGLTVIWLLHIILYVFTQPYPITSFLNAMLNGLDDAWPILGIVFYGVFAFYLLLCCIKGVFKFGMRIFLFPIHPMRVGNTLMHAFLFNVALIVICCFAVIQFCSIAFSEYAAQSSINSMFVLAVSNLKGLKYIFIGYVYALFIMVFLTGIYFVFKPKDKPAIDDF